MVTSPLAPDLQRLAEIAEQVGPQLRAAQVEAKRLNKPIAIESKGENKGTDYVTVHDKKAQEFIVGAMQRSDVLNGYGVIGEESSTARIRPILQDDRYYYEVHVDPIDGTGNFRNLKPTYAVSMGLVRGDGVHQELVGGVIHLPDSGATFAIDLRSQQPAILALNDAAKQWEAQRVTEAQALVAKAAKNGKELAFFYHEIADTHGLEEHLSDIHLQQFKGLRDHANTKMVSRQLGSGVTDLLESAILRKHGIKTLAVFPVSWSWDVVAGAAMHQAVPGNQTVFLEPQPDGSFTHLGSNPHQTLTKRTTLTSRPDNQVPLLIGDSQLVDAALQTLNISRVSMLARQMARRITASLGQTQQINL